MNRLITHLSFNGNCREAMSFYQKCLGGELVLQTLGESQGKSEIPEEFAKYILHASLTHGDIILVGTDLTDQPYAKGNDIGMLLEFDCENQLRDIYTRLLEGGRATYPLTLSIWGKLVGGLTDRYGNQWLFCQSSESNPY